MMNHLLRIGLTLGLGALGTAVRLAADEAPKAKAKTSPTTKAPTPSAKPKSKLKPVDINHASKEVLMFMLKIDDSLASRIIAGRPYPTKARLLTNHILTEAEYTSLKDRVIAGQGAAPR